MLTYDTPALRKTGSRNLTGQKMLPTIWGTYMKLVTKHQISAINSCWEKCDEKWAYMFNVYKNKQRRQTGSRNLMGPRTLHTIWHTYMKLVTKYQITVINSCLEKCDNKCAYTNVCKMCIKINKIGKQEVGIWWVQKRLPWYGVHIWSLWPTIRSLPSIVAEKNATKNEYMFNVYKNQQSRQTGSRNLMGPKTLPTIWGTYMNLVTKYLISAINSC